MDIIALFVLGLLVFVFLEKFAVARKEILEGRHEKNQGPVVRLDMVDTGSENFVILLYDSVSNKFLGQGLDHKDIANLIYKLFPGQEVTIKQGGRYNQYLDKEEQMDKPKIVFAPGAFDFFDGTQEELDSLITEITEAFESGDLMANTEPVDLDTLTDEERAALMEAFSLTESDVVDVPNVKRTLH